MNRPSATTLDWALPDASSLLAMPKNTDKSGLFNEEPSTRPEPAEATATATDEVSRFEDALGELETIVGQMERGDLKLEESLRLFERGVALTRQCRQSLETAELKVRNLLASDDSSAS
jgi:exodeoxyribonuclease VII small subunit